MQPNVWVGHRASDALMLSPHVSGCAAFVCYGATSRVAVTTWESAVGYRAPWGSDSQHHASRMFVRELARSIERNAAEIAVVGFRADPNLEALRTTGSAELLTLECRLFEPLSKKSFLLDLARSGVSVADGLEITPQLSTSYTQIASRLGTPFIVKTEQTVSGAGVYLVRSEREFEGLKAVEAASATLLTVWRFVDGVALNFHFCVWDVDTYVIFPPSLQLLSDANSTNPFRFVGNDFTTAHAVSAGTRSSAKEAVDGLVRELARRGYRGIGGTDVVANDTGASVVDLNPRFQGSSLLLSLSLRNEGIELVDLHAEALRTRQGVSSNVRHLAEAVAVRGGQLFVSHRGARRTVVTNAVFPGVYRHDGCTLIWDREYSDDFDQIIDDEVLILDTAPKGRIVEPRGSLLRAIYGSGAARTSMLGWDALEQAALGLFRLES